MSSSVFTGLPVQHPRLKTPVVSSVRPFSQHAGPLGGHDLTMPSLMCAAACPGRHRLLRAPQTLQPVVTWPGLIVVGDLGPACGSARQRCGIPGSSGLSKNSTTGCDLDFL